MTRAPRTRQHLAIAAAVSIIVVVIVLLVLRREPGEGTAAENGDGEAAIGTGEGALAEATRTVDLYFPGGGGGLHRETRELPVKDTPEGQIAALVEALIAGPADNRFRAPLPSEIAVRKVYLPGRSGAGDSGATVFLDLESPEGSPPPASGSQREMLTVYSLVNTVVLNVEEAEQVVLLWNGQQPVTFAGHLNTARPLKANRALIASSP